MSGRCGMRNSGSGIAVRGGAAARSAAGAMRRVKFEAIAINSVAKKKPTADDAAHYIGLEHIDPGCFVVSRWGGDVAPIGDKLLMKKGDVLFGRRRAYQRKVAIAPFDGIFSAHGMVLRPKTDVVDEKFFPFFIASDQFMNEAIRISVGGLSPTINWGTLKNCEFDLPPMDEQKKLAELLWAANDLKESYKKAITATDEMLKAKFREMFGDAGNDSSRGGAEVRRIKEFVKIVTGKKDVNFGNENGEFPFFTCAREVSRCDSYSFDCDAILVAGNCDIGNISRYEGKFEAYQRTYILTLTNDTTSLDYLYWVLKLLWVEDTRQKMNGSTIPYIKLGMLADYEFPLPPLSLQREFVAIADKAESAKANLKKSIAAIDQVMKGLING